MTTHRVVTTDTQIDQAIARAKALANEPRVTSVAYRPGPGLDLLILQMSDGHRCVLPREDLQGLQGATRQQLSQIEILGNGTGRTGRLSMLTSTFLRFCKASMALESGWLELGPREGSATSIAKRKAARGPAPGGGCPKRQESSAIAA